MDDPDLVGRVEALMVLDGKDHHSIPNEHVAMDVVRVSMSDAKQLRDLTRLAPGCVNQHTEFLAKIGCSLEKY